METNNKRRVKQLQQLRELLIAKENWMAGYVAKSMPNEKYCPTANLNSCKFCIACAICKITDDPNEANALQELMETNNDSFNHT